jgi:hypothetical protein
LGTYIKLGALVWEHKYCKGIFARSKLTLDPIRSMQADIYELPEETRVETSPNSSNQKIKALEKVTIDAFVTVTSQQTTLQILKLEGASIQ